MQKLFNKIGPLAVMAACAIWCCWSQLRESTPLLAASEAKLPRIERKLLHPELSPAGERDPFLQYKTAPPPVAADVETVVPEEPVFDPQTVLPSIRLDATIQGAKKLAVINGKVHVEGELVVLAEAPDVAVRLERVLSSEIVVKIEEATFRINSRQRAKQVAAPTPDADVVPPPHELEAELPAGTPTPDELDGAVADSLAQQARSTDDDVVDSSADTDDDLPAATEHDDEDCEFGTDLLINDEINELFDNYE